MPGEAQVPVPLLGTDDAGRLFVQRAVAVRPDFLPDDAAGSAIESICRHLDGLPLAIELAAARVKFVPVDHLATRLDDRFRLLSGGRRGVLPRHQTLRAAVEWSYDLLFDDERLAFRWMSTFAGTFTLEAAEAVCGAIGVDAGDVVNLVGRLVDKSLVVWDGTRYRMLETLRQFGVECLAESGELAAAKRAHGAYFADVAEQAAARVFAPDQVEWLDRLEMDHDNLRAALDWALVEDRALALAVAGAVAPAWWMRGHRQEARHLTDLALESDPGGAPLQRCRALRWVSLLADATGWSASPATPSASWFWPASETRSRRRWPRRSATRRSWPRADASTR